MSLSNPEPIVVAVALALYGYNVSPIERAAAIYQHFNGECLEMDSLVEIMMTRGAYVVTELPLPSAALYVKHAMQRYGNEALTRVSINRKFGATI